MLFHRMLAEKGLGPDSAEMTMHASVSQKLGLENAKTMVKLIDMLEDLDDVQKVYSNADFPEDVYAGLD